MAIVGIVGNKDGAHHVTPEMYRALAYVSFTTPGGGISAYWVGEAMGSDNYKDLDRTPKKMQQAIDTLASNGAHLAKLLEKSPYPAP